MAHALPTRRPFASRSRALLTLSLLLCAVACSDDAAPAASVDRPAAASPASADAAPAKAPKQQVDPASAGSVSGVVVVTGSVPPRQRLKMVGESFCLGVADDGSFSDERLIVNGDALVNAFVWISSDLSAYEFDEPTGEVIVDQRNCLFVPHVVGMQRGQTLKASNSDPVMHNVHTRPEESRAQNFGMPAGAKPRELSFKRPEVMVSVICDVHAWMTAWIGVVDHPYFAVTGADGSFRLAGLPAGQHTLGVWHETLGTLELPITVTVGEDTVVSAARFKL